ncbi:HEAT repeat domain-containing protein [Pontibacter pamirensis]|uniref:HEAT repeat domain-containing protein n=1 Tax=Pontibacter pamirensis TaxID=2562824 RepID=UPI001389B02A|nr:HEAT repeat domain-containing protein [Pontibacter pamirensis]
MFKTLTICLFLLLSFTYVKADTWHDPAWQTMIDSSDVIGLFQITGEGDFRARAKLLKSYKGILEKDEIWISGFSNRYGPIDTMRTGEKYILFLNKHTLTDEGKEYWLQLIEEEPELISFYNAIQQGLAYRVWSPTSGDFFVKGERVSYNLLSTSHSSQSSEKSFSELDEFLAVAVNNEPNRKFQKQLLHKLEKSLLSSQWDMASQYLMMLHLTGNRSYNKVFKRAVDAPNLNTRLALARRMGKAKSKKSREILITLLKDSSSVVQGEAVRQLSTESADFVGPVLLAQLKEAGTGGIYPASIMDPVRNELEGGKVEIIRTLGELKYKPAAKYLLPLLETEDEYLFKLVIATLQKLDNKGYIPYLNEHLKKGTESLIFDISMLISENDLEESKQALMDYISSHERNDQTRNEFAISTCCGLGHFRDKETIRFLLSDFSSFLLNLDLVDNSAQSKWLRQYFETFTDLQVEEARPLIYKSLFHWVGLSYEFAQDPVLFSVKSAKEDSINSRVRDILHEFDIKEVQTLAFIESTLGTAKNDNTEDKFIVQVKLKEDEQQSISLDEILAGGGENTKNLFMVLDSVRTKISRGLGVPIHNVNVQKDSFVLGVDNRFNDRFSLLGRFCEYATALPNENDLRFLKALAATDIPGDEVGQKKIHIAIQQIEEKLKK